MKMTYRTYKIVKFVNQEIAQLQLKHPNELREKGIWKSPLRTDIYGKYYAKTSHYLTYENIVELLSYAEKENFVEINDSNYVRVKIPKGLDLIDTFPFGFLEELFKKAPYLGGLVSGLLLAGLLALIRWLI
jgi:hypothetical protein